MGRLSLDPQCRKQAVGGRRWAVATDNRVQTCPAETPALIGAISLACVAGGYCSVQCALHTQLHPFGCLESVARADHLRLSPNAVPSSARTIWLGGPTPAGVQLCSCQPRRGERTLRRESVRQLRGYRRGVCGRDRLPAAARSRSRLHRHPGARELGRGARAHSPHVDGTSQPAS
jgi:hypothetical protein